MRSNATFAKFALHYNFHLFAATPKRRHFLASSPAGKGQLSDAFEAYVAALYQDAHGRRSFDDIYRIDCWLSLVFGPAVFPNMETFMDPSVRNVYLNQGGVELTAEREEVEGLV